MSPSTGSGTTGASTDYDGNYVYENGALKFFNHAEGYVEPDGNGGFEYIYQYKDHLGNIRLSYKDVGSTSTPSLQIQEENNYYPFGLKHKGYNNVVNGTENNHFTYNGKEFDESLGLDWLDYGARRYDPSIARWNGLDEYSEAFKPYSGYSFALNSPIQATDVDGKLVIYVNGFRKRAYERYVKRKANPWSMGANKPWNHKPRFFTNDHYNYWDEIDNMLGGSSYFNDRNNLYVDGMFKPHSTGEDRYGRGYKEGKILAEMILSGEIELEEFETIKLVGHSHGGAHATGMTDALIDAGLPVEYLVLIAPHQPTQFSLKNALQKSIQLSRLKDKVSSNQDLMKWYEDIFVGASKYGETEGVTFHVIMSDGDEDGLGNHSVDTYTDINDLKNDHPEIYKMLVNAGIINED